MTPRADNDGNGFVGFMLWFFYPGLTFLVGFAAGFLVGVAL